MQQTSDRMEMVDLLVVRHDEHGRPVFVDPPGFATYYHPAAVDVAYFWGVDGVPTLPAEIGGGLENVFFPAPGGLRFGFLHFPAQSAGKLNIRADSGAAAASYGSTPGMHRSDTLDFDVIVSGKIDLVLEGGERRTMRQGSCLVIGGALHSWDNVYDEPCTIAVLVYGSHVSTTDPIAH